MKLEDIYALWREDSVIDREALGDESLKISRLHQKYHEIYTNERLLLRKYENQLKVLKLEKYEFYTQGPTQETFDKGWKLPPIGKVIKTEVQNYLDADKELIELNLKIGLQSEKIELLNSIIKSLMTRQFQIKNAIDFMRWQSGT